MSIANRMNGVDEGGEEGSGRGVLIALHGHGDHPATALSWGRRMAPTGWDVLAPEADPDSDGVRSWFPFGPRGVDIGGLLRTLDRVESMASEVTARGGKVVIAGFSQGGATALAMAWRGTVAERVVSMCGFFPETDEAIAPTSDRRTAVMVLGTSGDAEVPAFMATDAAALFDTAGFATRSHVLSGAHHVDADLAATAASFLAGDVRTGPRFSISLPVDRVEPASEFTGVRAITELAAAYEQLGFDAAYVTDHPAPDERWLAGGGHHALDPLGPLGVAAAVTTRLGLHTNVYVLPYRNPFLAAKSLATLDVMSGGRLIAGVAAGYLRPEFNALGVDFDGRGAALEESLAVLPRIWSGATVADSGRGWEARSVVSLPATHGGPPIWIGGNSRAAMRRAVMMAQGWSPMPTPKGSGAVLRTTEIVDVDGLGRRLAEARELCGETGRIAPLTICFVPFTMGGYLADPVAGLPPMVDEIAQLFELGVDWFPLMVPGTSRSQVLDRAASLADALGVTPAVLPGRSG